MEKTCTVCGASKPLDQFHTKASGRFGVEARCKECQSKYRRAYYYRYHEASKAKSRDYHDANRDAANARFAAFQRAKYASDPEYRARRVADGAERVRALRLEVLSHYSSDPPSCVCCGESHPEFLHLDHINGGGSAHRKQAGSKGANGVLYYLKRNGYPEGYRVLCANCNLSRGRYGYCPHERS